MFGKVMPAYGLYLRHVLGVEFRDIRVSATKPDARPAMIFIDVQNIIPTGFQPDTAPISTPGSSSNP
jgi:hypothetical protein